VRPGPKAHRRQRARTSAKNRTYSAADPRVGIDGNGNLISEGREWDARDRLVSNGYGYDTGNLRVKMGEQKVLLDGIEEAREYGVDNVRWEHDPSRVDGLLAQKSGAGKGYFVTDALGSVYGVVDSTGAEVSKYGYDVYGARAAATERMLTSWGFTGRRHDSGSEVYYRERYLIRDGVTWMSPDPSGSADGPHVYLYVLANPVLGMDPLGLKTLVLVGAPRRDILRDKGVRMPSQDEWENLLARSLHPAKGVDPKDSFRVEAITSSAALGVLIADLAAGNPHAFDRVVFVGHMVMCYSNTGAESCGGLMAGSDIINPARMAYIADLVGATIGVSIGCGTTSVSGQQTSTDANYSKADGGRVKFCYTRETMGVRAVVDNNRNVAGLVWETGVIGDPLDAPGVMTCTR
jgi:RHS repeat-associated protein